MIWNHFENDLIPIIDELAPFVDFVNNTKVEKNLPNAINNKSNLRKRLLKKLKHTPTEELKQRIKNLFVEIRSYFIQQKDHQ